MVLRVETTLNLNNNFFSENNHFANWPFEGLYLHVGQNRFETNSKKFFESFTHLRDAMWGNIWD